MWRGFVLMHLAISGSLHTTVTVTFVGLFTVPAVLNVVASSNRIFKVIEFAYACEMWNTVRNSIEVRLSARRWAGHRILHVELKPIFRHRINKCLSLDTLLSHLNPVHVLKPYFIMVNFNTLSSHICTPLSSNHLRVTGDGKVELGHCVIWTKVNKKQNNFNVRLLLVCGVLLCYLNWLKSTVSVRQHNFIGQ